MTILDLKQVMQDAYGNMTNAYWGEKHVKKLIGIFPESQVAIKIDDQLAGCALSIIVNEDLLNHDHTYEEVTGNYSFSTHTLKGDTLYGIDVL